MGPHTADFGPQKILEGVRICLVRETAVLYHGRFLRQIRLLQDAGAEVVLLTGNPDPADKPKGVEWVLAPLDPSAVTPSRLIPASHHPARPVRIASNIIRNLTRCASVRWELMRMGSRSRRRELRRIARVVDLFWVIDFPALSSTVDAARRWGNGKVLYDTIDLVPEYAYSCAQAIHQPAALETERQLIGSLAGFITAADSYADYYDERYGDLEGYHRPIVFGNAPEGVLMTPGKRSGRTRFIFLGALAFNRPIEAIIRGVAASTSDIEVVFQGAVASTSVLEGLIQELGLETRVAVVPPCPVDGVVEVASRFDVGIVALDGANENERRAETTKLYTYMAAGLAVLGSELPGIAGVVNRAGNGILIQGMSPQAWAAGFDAFAAMKEEQLATMRIASVNYALDHRPSTQADAMIREFARALGKHHDSQAD